MVLAYPGHIFTNFHLPYHVYEKVGWQP